MELSFSNTFRGMDGVVADVDDPGQYEGPPANAQQYGAEKGCLNYRIVAVLVHQGDNLGGVRPDHGGHGQTQQEEEEQAEVETLSHQGGLVQDFLLTVLQKGLVVVVVVGEDAGERVEDQPWALLLL